MKAKKANTTQMTDEGPLHRYRIELPVLIDDMQLSVYAFRLYAHIKRRAGDTGKCYEGTRGLSAICCMSVGQVTKAKAELEAAGVIERSTQNARGGQVDVIVMVDLWPQNMRTYCKDSRDHVVMPKSESVHSANTSAESVHSTNTFNQAFTTGTLSNLSVHENESKCSPGERKKIHVQEDDDDDGDRTLAFLRDKGIGAAKEFAQLPYDQLKRNYEQRIAAGQDNGAIVLAWRRNPPTRDYHDERPERPAPADRPRRPTNARTSQFGSGQSDVKDPGWRERLIKQAEAGELP